MGAFELIKIAHEMTFTDEKIRLLKEHLRKEEKKKRNLNWNRKNA